MFSTYDCSRVRLTDAKEKEILHCLRNYNKSMGSDLTEFAENLNVTRQRVRVVARQYGIPLPFADETTARMEEILRRDAEELLVKRQRSKLGLDVKDSDNPMIKTEIKHVSTKSKSKSKSKIVYIRSASPASKSKSSSSKSKTTDFNEKISVVSSDNEKVKQTRVRKTRISIKESDVEFSNKKSKFGKEDKLQENTPKQRGGVKRQDLPEDVKVYLVENASRSWTHLAKETGVSISRIERFLKNQGFERPGKRQRRGK